MNRNPVTRRCHDLEDGNSTNTIGGKKRKKPSVSNQPEVVHRCVSPRISAAAPAYHSCHPHVRTHYTLFPSSKVNIPS